MAVTINGAGTITGLTSADVPQVNVTTKLLVGGPTSTAGAFGVQVYGSSSTNAPSVSQRGFSDTAGGPNLLFIKTRGTTYTSVNAVQQNDTLGALTFYGTDGTNAQVFGAITVFVDGAVSTGTVPTAMTFTTGSTVGLTRMIINSSGQIGMGTATPASASALEIASTTQGVRFPVMTTAQKNAIGTPVTGLVVFDTTLAKLCVYSGSAWQTITSV
jgi:hypothetical protein